MLVVDMIEHQHGKWGAKSKGRKVQSSTAGSRRSPEPPDYKPDTLGSSASLRQSEMFRLG